MKIKKLIKDLPIEVFGNKDTEINGICADSRFIAPGNLFIAKKGKTTDGLCYIPNAINAGATAILSDYFDPSLKGITQLIHPNVAEVEAILADRYSGHPSKKLSVISVTGTNGKTTCSFMIQHLLQKEQEPCGRIGTLGYDVGGKTYDATHTTPDVTRVHKLLHEMTLSGCRAAVVEATSHALDQARLAEVTFAIAAFTNLSHDHLDYHKTFEKYKESKLSLFSTLPESALAVAPCDDPITKEIQDCCKAPVILYGLKNQADCQAKNIVLSKEGAQFTLSWKGEEQTVHLPLIGMMNVYNALLSATVALAMGLHLSSICKKLSCMPQVPGRMEMIETDRPFSVIVDFAHTPDALTKATKTVRQITENRVITVFGCGGDRDQEKRPLMAQAVEKESNLIIVTSDNPRLENPQSILSEISKGFLEQDKVLFIPDRKEAIEYALSVVDEGDTILIAGKGHESVQHIQGRCIPFSDREIVREFLQESFLGV